MDLLPQVVGGIRYKLYGIAPQLYILASAQNPDQSSAR